MSSRKSKAPRGARVRATLDVRPSPEQIEAARGEGRTEVLAEVHGKSEQLRSDAAALERAADVMSDAQIMVGLKTSDVPRTLRAVAAGLRLAADRMPSEIPF